MSTLSFLTVNKFPEFLHSENRTTVKCDNEGVFNLRNFLYSW